MLAFAAISTVIATVIGRRRVIGRGRRIIGGRGCRRRLNHDWRWRRIIGVPVIVIIVTTRDGDRDRPEKRENHDDT
jgi:hypothetical protein